MIEKILNIAFGFRNTLLWGIAFFFLLLAGGCRDDFNGIYKPMEEKSGLTLYIPSVKGVIASRGGEKTEDPASEAEGRITALKLYAYKVVDGEVTGDPVCKTLAAPSALTQEYAKYEIEFDPGTYRFYLTGNLSPYTATELADDIDEGTLRETLLHFSAEQMPSTAEEYGLPMAALCEDIQEHIDGEVEVLPYRGAQIHADLRFLCSKVRLTLFYDGDETSGFSSQGLGSDRPQFQNFNLWNVADRTRVDGNQDAEHGFFDHYGSLIKMDYPAGISSEDDVRGMTTSKLDGMKVSADQEMSSKQMAWSTTLYLPENLHTLVSEGTSMTLNAKLEGNDRQFKYHIPLPGTVTDEDGEKTSKPLRRGEFHDFTACVKSIAEFPVTARVEPWTLKSIVHKIHGPYFLQVEKTEKVAVTAGEETHLWYKSDVPVSFESQQVELNGKKVNVLLVDTMPGHSRDSLVIMANPVLPVNYDLSESYFDIIAGNIKKRIQIWPFVIQPFFKVSPPYTAVEVRELIQSGSNTMTIPIHFMTNLDKVDVRITDGWNEEELPVEFRVTGQTTSQTEGKVTYEGEIAKDNYNFVVMSQFLTGNPYWQSNHTLKLEYRAYLEDGTQFGPVNEVEIEVIPKRFNYRIYFRPQSDDWASPHVYIYESLALPKVLDQSKVEGLYKARAGKPVGGFVYREPGNGSEAGLAYSFTGKVSFLGWSTQGGPAENNPYEDVEFNPSTADGFYVFGHLQSIIGGTEGKMGYGMKYIPPANRKDWWISGPSEEEIRKHYDIDTDHMAAHRSQLTTLCPACTKNDTYNMKFPGIRMLPSKVYPGWYYADLTEVASPGKTLIMFHDGHTFDGYLIVPGDHEPGVPLFDFPDNEGWMYYAPGQTNFVNDKPADIRKYKEDTYRLIWPKRGYAGVRLGMMDNRNARFQGYFYETKDPSGYKSWDENFNYVEFKLSDVLNSHFIQAALFSDVTGEVEEKLWLYRFEEIDGIKYYTYTGVDEGHPGLPLPEDADTNVYRIYWVSNPDVKGFNLWFDGYMFNNFDNASQSYIESMEYISGTEDFGGRKYDYFEFIIPQRTYSNHGWQMHTQSKGTYGYLNYVDLTDFIDRDGTGIYSVFRDDWYTVRPGRPYWPQGNKFRLCWPKSYTKEGVDYDINTAWIWGFPDPDSGSTDGRWIYPAGETTYNGVTMYYYDFTVDTAFDDPNASGFIPRSEAQWGVGCQPNSQNLQFCRYQFDYDPAIGRNVVYFRPDFLGSY